MSVPFLYTKGENGGVLNIMASKAIQVSEDHPAFALLVEALQNDASEAEIYEIASQELSVKKFIDSSPTDGRASVRDGKVFVDGEEVHGTIVSRINDLMEQGIPFDNLLRFLDRLALNPSMQSREELYDFLENENLPITEDGYFIAYKAVTSEYKDLYSRTIDNSPGQHVKIDRTKVDDNRNRGCAKGLHVGAISYVYSYGGSHSNIVVVKVDPAGVVSVPHCSAHQKCRVCEYEVLRDFDGELTDAVYDRAGFSSLSRNRNEKVDFGFSKDDHGDFQDDFFDQGDVTSYGSDYDEDEEEYDEDKDDETYDDFGW